MTKALKHEVIIIGAGMAGLTAASHLANFGFSVLILEARNRVGGRIHTIESAGYPFEAGANLLYHSGTAENLNPLVPLLRHHQLKTLALDTLNSETFDPAGAATTLKELFNRAKPHFEAAQLKIQKAKKESTEIPPTLAEVLDLSFQSPRENTDAFIAKQLLQAMIAEQTGASAHLVSLLELLHSSPYQGNDAFITDGYQQLPKHLAQELIQSGKVAIQLNTPIQTIHYDQKNHRVSATDKQGIPYEAQAVLCTVPLGVLKEKKIRFIPELSKEKSQAIQHLQVGYHNKVFLEFETVFWPEDVHFLFPGSTSAEEWPTYINLYHFSNHKTKALIANFYADAARFGSLSKEDIIKKALLPLQRAYGVKTDLLKNTRITHWDKDPYALGSVSCSGPKLKASLLNEFERIEPGGLFFAGGHTIQNGNQETVHGAVTSGFRAAMALNKYLKQELNKTHSSFKRK